MASGGRTDWHIDTARYHDWLAVAEPGWRNEGRAESRGGPLLSIVLPTYNTPLAFLREALDSIRGQQYTHWQLCIADDHSGDEAVREVLRAYQQSDQRIDVLYRQCNGGIAAASNDALSLAHGEYVVFMDHDDVLPDYALAQVARAVRDNPEAGLFFSDSDLLDAQGERCRPFFKPDWNYELFLAQNYLNHLSVFRRDLLLQLNGFRSGFEGSQDYDLALRAIERLQPKQIVHLPQVLYHWRELATSVSRSDLKAAVASARRAVSEHLERKNQAATVCAADQAVIYNRVRWAPPKPAPRAGIVLFGEDGNVLQRAAGEIDRLTDYPDYLIRDLLVSTDRPFDGLNALIESLDADVVVLLRAELIPEHVDWLWELVPIASRPGVGCVGPKCISREGGLAGGPWLLGVDDPVGGGLVGMACRGATGKDKGYHARLALDQNVSVVHGAALVLQHEHFTAVGGLDEALSHLALLGADLSLKVQGAGLSNIWTAHTRLRCIEGAAQALFNSPATEQALARFRSQWRPMLPLDPFYNRNLSTDSGNFELAVAPRDR